MCQLFRMKSNCSAGKGPCEPQCCGFPQLWAYGQALPRAASLTHLTPPIVPHLSSIQPTSSLKNSSPHQPPVLSSTFQGGALVKSNPIIRLSAVPEKKELSPRFFFGLPFLFPPSFSLQVQARRHFGPFWPVAFVFLQT